MNASDMTGFLIAAVCATAGILGWCWQYARMLRKGKGIEYWRERWNGYDVGRSDSGD